MNHIQISVGCLMCGIVFGGCALTREDQLHRKSDRVEAALLKERDRVANLTPADPEREPRLDHLGTLRATLSAANIGLASIPHVVPPDKRDLAYDVLEEAYDTIMWNVPLGPNDAKRSLPLRFSGSTLLLDERRSGEIEGEP